MRAVSFETAVLAGEGVPPRRARRVGAALRALQIIASIGLLAWVIRRVDGDSVLAICRIDPVTWTSA